MPEKPNVTLPGTVEKIIKSPDPSEPEKAQINIEEGADPLYKELRIENALTDQNGNEVKLKQGARVEVTVEASPSGIIPKKDLPLTSSSTSEGIPKSGKKSEPAA